MGPDAGTGEWSGPLPQPAMHALRLPARPRPSTALGSRPWPHTDPPCRVFLEGSVHIYLLLSEPRALPWDTGWRPPQGREHPHHGRG